MKRAILIIAIPVLREAVRMLDEGGHCIVGSAASFPDGYTAPDVRLVIESDLLPDDCGDKFPLLEVNAICKVRHGRPAQIAEFNLVTAS